MEAGAGTATGRSRGQLLRRRTRAVQRINMVFSIGNPLLREPAKSRCGGKDAQICISLAVSTGLYVPLSFPSAGRCGPLAPHRRPAWPAEGWLSPHAPREVSVVAFESPGQALVGDHEAR